MGDFTFNTTPSIRQMAGGAAKLGTVIESLPTASEISNVFFVTDPGIMKLGLADAALASLKASGFKVTIFSDIEPDPKSTTVLDAVEMAKSNDAACVVGFGGGSSLDVAKMVALMVKSEQPLEEAYGINKAKGKRLPMVLVPTTAGTGSEVTAVSVLTTGEEEKQAVISPILLPDIGLLDADLTIGLPAHITAATGVDAMVHAIEAYTSKNVNNNPISRNLAKLALELLGGNIREAVHNGSNREARENMLLGSMFAGQAFANSPVSAVHAFSYPVGSQFHVPHGLSNALVLDAVLRFNAPECGAQYAELAPHVFPDIDQNRSAQDVSAEFIDRLAELSVDLGIKPGLKHVGVKEADLPKLTDDVMNQTRLLANNPRDVSIDDARSIYEASY